MLHDRLFAAQSRGGCEHAGLHNDESLDTGAGDVEHFAQLVAGVGRALRGGLSFDESARGGEDDVAVGLGLRVFLVVEVEKDLSVDDADGDGGDEFAHGGCGQGAGGDEFVEGQGKRGGSAGDGGGAGAAVGLEDVAIENDGALAEDAEVHDGAQGAADEALDFVGAATDLAALGLARCAGERGAGKHGVLGGDPAFAAVAEPGGHGLLDGGVAKDAGVAELDENGAFRGGDEVWGEADGAELVRGAAVCAENGWGFHGSSIEVGSRCIGTNKEFHGTQSERLEPRCAGGIFVQRYSNASTVRLFHSRWLDLSRSGMRRAPQLFLSSPSGVFERPAGSTRGGEQRWAQVTAFHATNLRHSSTGL